MKAARRTLLAAGIVLAAALGACGKASNMQALSPAEQQELKTLSGQLADPSRSAKTKREAATLLLNRSCPQAAETIRGFLADSTNRPAQQAVAEAIARHGGGEKMFIDPLMAMMVGQDATARGAAGRALASYKNHGVTDKLIEIAADAGRDATVRLVAIRSLASVLDKRAVQAMVHLLDDRDERIRQGALESLAKLTNIRTFASDPAEWKRWWTRNRHKDRSEWLADLADSLGKAKAALGAENANLRDRLSRAMMELYSAVPPAQREAILLGFLRDQMAEARLVGTILTYRRLAASESVSEEIRLQIMGMLADPDPRVRRRTAVLLANLGDGESLSPLLQRLEVEDVAEVRQGLLTALGQLRLPEALPAVLEEVSAPDVSVAAAAAAALARLVEAHPLDETLQDDAVEALKDRYALAAKATNGAELQLREALLAAMGKVKDKAFVDVLAAGLKDPAATVRLAAAGALEKLGDSRSADLLVPLVGDADRGVRQAAIAAIGALGTKRHLPVILRRTDPTNEADAAVRKQAWEVTMSLLSGADAEALRVVADSLAGREDALDQRIVVLGMLVQALNGGDNTERAAAQRQLGLALMGAGRPAEAEPHLADAWKVYADAEAPEADQVWLEWIDTLLMGDDPAVTKAMDGQVDDARFAEALARFNARLAGLGGENKHVAVIALISAAMKDLPHRLTVEQREDLQKLLAGVKAARNNEDRQSVLRLLAQSRDEEQRSAARKQLEQMGNRAVMPLLEELKNGISSANPDARKEQTIIEFLAQLAPELKGYDPAAPLEDKLKTIDAWRKNFQ